MICIVNDKVVSFGFFGGLFFQAEDGIRDGHVTGVQSCALPISTTIHGSRQIGTTTRRVTGSSGSAHHSSRALRSQSGRGHCKAWSKRRSREWIASGTVRMSVTQTGTPRARNRSTSSLRFSSLLAMTRSGSRRTIFLVLGFLVHRTLEPSRSYGWVHLTCTPVRSATGRPVLPTVI